MLHIINYLVNNHYNKINNYFSFNHYMFNNSINNKYFIILFIYTSLQGAYFTNTLLIIIIFLKITYLSPTIGND